MNSFRDFRAALITGLATLLLAIAGYLYAGQDAKIQQLDNRVDDHAQQIAKLNVLVDQQVQINRDLKEIIKSIIERDRFSFKPPPPVVPVP
jgi:cell division protein FtsB